MRAMLLKTNGRVEVVDPDTLDDYYELIGCHTIDIVRDLKFMSRPSSGVYDLIVDDDGLADDGLALNALALFYFGRALVGNVLITMSNRAGERTPYDGPALVDLRPEGGFTFVAVDDAKAPE